MSIVSFYECGCEVDGSISVSHCPVHECPYLEKVIETPHGDITLVPPTREAIAMLKASLLELDDIELEGDTP